MFKKDPITVFLIIMFIYPILKGFVLKYRASEVKTDLRSLGSTIAFLVSLFLGFQLVKNIFIKHEKGVYSEIYKVIPKGIIEKIQENPLLIYLVVMPVVIVIIYALTKFIIGLINSIIFYPIFDGVESLLKESNVFIRRIAGAIFQIPKAIAYVLILTFIFNYISVVGISSKLNGYLSKSTVYNRLCEDIVSPINNSEIAKKIPNIISDSFRIEVQEVKESRNGVSKKNNKVIVYYNGITLEEGIKSNEQINNYSKQLAREDKSDLDKARSIYEWVSKSIEYDSEKAKKIMNNDFSGKSGTINTFNTKKGICFDYTCVVVSMCRANNLKVRVITGKGFDGRTWVSHAWNQVYIPEKERWINLDATFGVAGDYFNTTRFKFDHKDAQIAGEW